MSGGGAPTALPERPARRVPRHRWARRGVIALGVAFVLVGLAAVGAVVFVRAIVHGRFHARLPAPSTPVSTPSIVPAAALRVELIGVLTIPTESDAPSPEASRVGGLSGLAFHPGSGAPGQGQWLAVSDTDGAVRYTFLDVELERSEPGGQLRVRARVSARRAGPEAVLPPKPRDAEAIAAVPGTGYQPAWILGFEKLPTVGVLSGNFKLFDPLPVPPNVAAACPPNRAFESVVFLAAPAPAPPRPDEAPFVGGVSGPVVDGLVWAVTESALDTDPARASTGGTRNRVLEFDLRSRTLRRHLIYETQPPPVSDFGLPSINRLSDMAALPDGRVLALERSFSFPTGYDAELFVLDGSTRPGPEGGAGIRVLTTSRVVRLRDLGISLQGNLEAIGVGPPLDDPAGGRLVLVLADDNYGSDGQRGTQVIALRLLGPGEGY